jgi:Zn finger protein HypA/HybF involved in hydrogenase expression
MAMCQQPKEEPPVKRECLKCGKRFGSTGPGNRICPACTSDMSRRQTPGIRRVRTPAVD